MGNENLENEPDVCYLPNLKMPFFDARIPIVIPSSFVIPILIIIFVIICVVIIAIFFAQVFQGVYDQFRSIIGVFKKTDKQKDFEQRIAAISESKPVNRTTSNNLAQPTSPYDYPEKTSKSKKMFCSECGSENAKQGDFCQNCGKKFE